MFKRTFVIGLLTLLYTALAVGMDVPGTRIDIIVSDDNAALGDLARDMQNSLASTYTGADIQIRTPQQISSTTARAALAIAIGDNLLQWTQSELNPYAATISFYVSSLKFKPADTDGKIAALYRDQPLVRQLLLAKLILPNLRQAAAIHDNDGLPVKPEMLQRETGVAVKAESIEGKSDWAKTLSGMMMDNDILLGVDDPEVYNRDTIRSILLTTYRRGKILIGPSRPFVAAGSLASAYTSSEQFLQQLNTMVGEYLLQGRLPPSQYPKYYRIAINQQVAASLGLTVPDETTLYERMQKKPGECGNDC